jgi:predicted DNA-binding WGR domain protein
MSLDANEAISDPWSMIIQPYRLYVERSDPARNMARYYTMSIEKNLFGDICLLRKWGRIGTKGKMMIHHFRQEGEAVRLFLDLLRQKRKRGYGPPQKGDSGSMVPCCPASTQTKSA